MAGVMALCGSIMTSTLPLQASGLPRITTNIIASRSPQLAQARASSPALPDGTYLFGETDQPGQIGQEYLVFQVKQGQAIGALYMPHSAFYCFQGQFKGQSFEVSVNLWDAPEGEQNHQFAIALKESPTSVASVGKAARSPVSLKGYVPLTVISNNDHRILNTCLTNFSG